MDRIILEGIEKQLKDNAVIGHSQDSFMRGKSFLSKLTSLYDRVTHLVDLGKPADVILWTPAKLSTQSLTVSFQTRCPAHSSKTMFHDQ